MPDSFPEWYSHELPDRNSCVIRPLLDRGKNQHPDRIFAKFENGTEWTYFDLWLKVRSWAAGLQKVGVSDGDAVLVWLPNRPEIINAWFAINYIGASYAPVNTAYRGDLLAHVIKNSGAKILIAHRDLISRLSDINQIKKY